ncbi:4-azaleucine resistance transporter AzlC [Natronobacillus azotifigens]|uniref:AzlC family ABC transporter permease n=1 Tax=Natronobacillus azotifigens TaxID=472978 RepID=A0A9J6R9U7_9BACI|nr:AzlC family ABC transporter permease [Natronobacillus azotifigens]MCZ0702060.1 AzlC family ABC transporter permease [Natronobacillus azotifigens]
MNTLEVEESGIAQTKKIQLKQGIMSGFPIMLGYFPIAITYGVLAAQSGLTLLELTGMSIFVYAGAAQFMGTNMLEIGAGAMEIIIATFVLNFRHFVMSLSFMNRARSFPLRWKFPISLLLTDESFSVASVKTEQTRQPNGSYFYLGMFMTAYLSWIIGSVFGGILGDIMPDSISQSLGIALYAMFIALLVPSVKIKYRYGLIAGIAMVFNYLFSFYLDEGWSIVVSTLLASFIGIFVIRGMTYA